MVSVAVRVRGLGVEATGKGHQHREYQGLKKAGFIHCHAPYFTKHGIFHIACHLSRHNPFLAWILADFCFSWLHFPKTKRFTGTIIAISTFDTLKFVRRLEEAGVPSKQAEVLTEAFNVNLESLVTKEHLTARFAEQDARIDTRFAEQQAYMDIRFAQIDSKFRFLSWTQAIIIAAVIMPYLERLAA
tara:strand:+ start:2347 stop:2907 length:561 start_codon:yes stop_codon:yes gene_type:complete